MAGRGSAQARKRVDSPPASLLVRAKDGSAFARCEECNKDVPVALINMHSCSLEAKIKMSLESQIVEKPTEVKNPSERKKPKSKEPKAKRAKADKDPNMPKRPPTAFFLFLEGFRKDFKEADPDSKDVKRVGKEAGEKWKSMTDEDKKPYLDKVAELKAEYDKALESYNTAQEDQEGSDKEDMAREEEVISDDE